MKKLLVMSLALLATMSMSAQVKVAPTLQKGMKKVYSLVSKANMGGQIDFTVNYDLTYAVTDASAEGFTIDITTSNLQVESTNGLMAEVMNLGSAMLENQPISVLTDKDGKIQKIANFEQVKAGAADMIDKCIDNLYKNYPSAEQMVPRDELKAQVSEGFTEESLLSVVTNATTPMALNGMTVQSMAQDNIQGGLGNMAIPMKRMFFVTNSNKTITTNSQVNMTPEELKAFIIKQVEENAPEQAEMIKQNIDAVAASGMMKVEGNEKTIYNLDADGWMKSIEQTSNLIVTGQHFNAQCTVTLK